eukprot:Blabericola_migrator_1__3558@NODE_2056_length_3352_cov_12_391781_g1261_i1_p3_GENE_NODE_2056_length_3352_cov_12_391781_g1261_i1NODE_2056_length_3352_cov_12_391781_g1261_i1_p3_ORF_typecomplete_len111_score18_07_NODE_2056_length_3352_cov_12_391781_g1261_i119502282
MRLLKVSGEEDKKRKQFAEGRKEGEDLSAWKFNPKKVLAVANLKPPKDAPELKSFPGLTGYLRRFIKGYANIVKPLTLLTRNSETWRWEAEHQAAFEKLLYWEQMPQGMQ